MHLGVIGEHGETLAVAFLRRKGYKILTRNYQTRWGEVDIIARDGACVVFAEVKTRSADALYAGRDAVTVAKQERVRKAAMQYWQENECNLQPRFDVVEVTLGNGKPCIEHIENAF